MPFEKYYDVQQPVTEPACIHLRSKAMYVTGDLRNPDHPDEVGSQYCWCNMTQHVIGPDQQEVGRPLCISGRQCFRDTY
jgi:hypothetical protein